MIRDGSIQYINILLIEFHNYKINISQEVDKNIIKQLTNKNIKIITEDMVAKGKDPKGNWFKLL